MPTRIIFNTNKALKEKAQKRARKEGTDLTSVLNQTLVLYGEGIFDPDDFLTKEDIAAIRRAEADIKAGRLYTLEEIEKELGI